MVKNFFVLPNFLFFVSRHTTELPRSSSLPPPSLFTRPSLNSRKRDHTSSGPLTSLSQSLKKPRVFRPPSPWKQPSAMETTSSVPGSEVVATGDKKGTGSEVESDHMTMPETGQSHEGIPPRFVAGSGTGMGRLLKLSIPESECESDNESVRGGNGAGGGCVKGDGVEESSVDSGRGSRGSTPPIQEEEEETREEERARRNVSFYFHCFFFFCPLFLHTTNNTHTEGGATEVAQVPNERLPLPAQVLLSAQDPCILCDWLRPPPPTSHLLHPGGDQRGLEEGERAGQSKTPQLPHLRQ